MDTDARTGKAFFLLSLFNVQEGRVKIWLFFPGKWGACLLVWSFLWLVGFVGILCVWFGLCLFLITWLERQLWKYLAQALPSEAEDGASFLTQQFSFRAALLCNNGQDQSVVSCERLSCPQDRQFLLTLYPEHCLIQPGLPRSLPVLVICSWTWCFTLSSQWETIEAFKEGILCKSGEQERDT